MSDRSAARAWHQRELHDDLVAAARWHRGEVLAARGIVGARHPLH